MITRKEAERVLSEYRKAREWLDAHPVTTCTPEERLAVHRIAAYWAQAIERL